MTTTSPAPDASAAWRALMHDHSIQFAFPDAAAPRKPPAWLEQLLKFLAQHGAWFKYAGWALLAFLVLVAVYYIVRFVRGGGLKPAASPAAYPLPAWQPSARQARLLLTDADALAAQGRFDEAAHLLLLVSIQQIGDRRPGLVLPALTSREIARLDALSPRAQHVFSAIARVVERCVFGGRAIAATDYAQVRAQFEQFTVSESWTAVAA